MTKSINLYWVLVGILVLGIFFLGMDNCGSSRKYDELRGTYEAYRVIATETLKRARGIIKIQTEEINKLDKKITFLQEIIEVKDEDLAEIEEELGELRKDFASLKDCQTQYNKLVEAFTLCKSISADKDGVIFSLNKKYEAQVKISLEYKELYDSIQTIVDIRTRQIKELEKINKRLKFTSGAKTGIVIGLAAVVVYGLLKD